MGRFTSGTDSELGQTAVEWLGIAAVTVAIIAAVVMNATSISTTVSSAYNAVVCRASGTSCAGTGSSAGIASGGQPGSSPQMAGAPASSNGAESGSTTSYGDRTLSPAERGELTHVLASGDPAAIHQAMSQLSEEETAALVHSHPQLVAYAEGAPQDARVAANRSMIENTILAMNAEIEARRPENGWQAAGDAIHDAFDWVRDGLSIPDHLGGGSGEFVFGPPTADTDTESIAQLERRVDQLQTWLDEDRQIISYVPPTDLVNGDAKLVEVFGDLDTAENVGVIVPGIWNHDGNYDHTLRPSAIAMDTAAQNNTAVVAWLGYDGPDGLTDGAAFSGTAVEGADALTPFVAGVNAGGDRNVTLVGHSYGSRVVSETAQNGADIDRLVLLGSPGAGVPTAQETGVASENVYVGMNPDDPIQYSTTLVHGRNPARDDFGGTTLPTQETGHGGYFDLTGGSGPSVAALIDGRADEAAVVNVRGDGTK